MYTLEDWRNVILVIVINIDLKNLTKKIYFWRTAVNAKLFPDLKFRVFAAVLYNANPLILSNVFFFPLTGSFPFILSSKFTTYRPLFLPRL